VQELRLVRDATRSGVSFGYEDTADPANSFRLGRAELTETVTFVGGPEAVLPVTRTNA
jgi:hypothetical protein